MTWTLERLADGAVLALTVNGDFMADAAQRMNAFMAEVETGGPVLLLQDLAGATQLPGIGMVHRGVKEQAAVLGDHVIATAVVVRELDSTATFTEDAAVINRVRAQFFTSRDEALAWLLRQASSTG